MAAGHGGIEILQLVLAAELFPLSPGHGDRVDNIEYLTFGKLGIIFASSNNLVS